MMITLISNFGVKQAKRQTGGYYDHCLSSASNLKIRFGDWCGHSLKEPYKREADIQTLSYLAGHQGT